MKYIFGLAIWRKKISQIKGYVWPDWFCSRVVPLDRPWKEHQPLYVFFIFLFPFWIFEKTSKFWAAPYKTESNLQLVRMTVCIESFLPIGWGMFIWWKNLPKCCTILVWIAECWNSVLTSVIQRPIVVSRISGDRFGGKDCGLWPYNPWYQQVGDAFLYEAAQNFEVFSKI